MEEVPMPAHAPHHLTRRDVLKDADALPTLATGAPPIATDLTTASATSAPPKALISALVAANTAFALDLCQQLRQSSDGILLVSPYCIPQALSMTYAGTRGDTAAHLVDELAFTLPQPALHEA
jgi:serpin B